ncbi:choice-of-anchor D domain-containing protein [Vibrio sp. SCSIO 43135]|uniref:choice-of-anchor D domain-containing protein n=1 Tax=Vibrio sp. SCSIO 43135 TaxID=2819096 RepID=UPI0020754332|nr:choice-of-anchor D domain-containing protein [Vibrio sp. SCSIO 43135]USD43662.1 choice-of-anchor D domain-containing protein [Vibrio sp. SCSIO 43135]
MKFPITVPFLLSGFMVHATSAETILADDFNSGLSQWQTSGDASTNSSYVIDGLSAYLKVTGSITKQIDTAHYSNLEVSYSMAARLLEDPDYCHAEYSLDGGTFTNLSTLGNGQDNGSFYFNSQSLPNATTLTLRFRAATGTADHCYVEDVAVTGDASSVNPEPQISVNETVQFGSVTVNETVQQNLTVSNSGAALLNIGSISSPSSNFSLSNDSCTGSSLNAGETCQMSVTFSPVSVGSYSSLLTISSNDPNNANTDVSLLGYGSADSGDGYVENYQPLNGSGNVTRTELTHAQLNSNNPITQLVSTQAFSLPADAAQPSHQFEGSLKLTSPATAGIGQFTEHKDTYRYTSNADDPRKHIPEFNFEFVQSGTHLIPVQRGIQLGAHPYWEYILEPGRVWKETGDNGDSRAAFPFSIMQKNSNCVHNGLMTFTFNDQSVSQVAYQIASETCLYYQFDMWGSTDAEYTPKSIANSLSIKQAHQTYESSKIEMRPISQLAADYPTLNIDTNNFGHASEVTPEYMSVFGVFFEGIHYTGGCETRQGMHPYCDRLRVPSYSTAKTTLAGTASMRLETLYPGYMESRLTDLIPEAAADPEGDWVDVTPNNAIDMATGNYRLSSGYLSDEYSTANDTGFFLVLDHQGKLDYSVSRYPRKAQPGTFFNYHTTDTYIATVAAQNFIKGERGNQVDIFDNIIVDDIWTPLNVDEGTKDTRRTYDSEGMPFGGYGLTYLRDDIVKLVKFTSIDQGVINGQAMLDPAELRIAMFQDPNTPPLDVRSDSKYYSNSVWAKLKTVAGNCEIYAPYMSGYGGIQFVMLPNDVIYYYVSDNNEFVWDKALEEANKLAPYCP